MLRSISLINARFLPYLVLALLNSLGTFDPLPASAYFQAAPGRHEISADYCSRHPELFKVRALTAAEGMGLIQPAAEIPTIRKFESGKLVSGACTKFIKTFANGIILTNNARFGMKDFAFVPAPPPDPRSGPQPNYFVPPENVLSIATDKFVEGSGRYYVASGGFGSDHLVLWSGAKGSAIGTIRCESNNSHTPCKLDHLILSSRYPIREIDFLPGPHPEMTVGELWLAISLGPTRDAIVTYTIEYGHIYGR